MKHSLNHQQEEASKEHTPHGVYVRAIEWLISCVLSIAIMVVFMITGMAVAALFMLITAMWCACMSFRSIQKVDQQINDDRSNDNH